MFISKPIAFGISATAGILAVLYSLQPKLASHPAHTASLAVAQPAAAQPSVTVPPTTTKMTPAEVVTVADAFCKAVGVKTTGPLTPQFLGVPTRDDGSLPPYWKPTWIINQGALEIRVSDTDRSVVYLDPPIFDDGSTLAGKGMAEARALSIAQNVIKAARLSETLAAPDFNEIQRPPPHKRFQRQHPARQASHEYVIIYHRKALGLEFRDQSVTVRMNAETGEIVGWQVVFQTPAPHAVKPKLTPEQAETAALKYLAKNANRDIDWEPIEGTTLVWVSEPTGARQTPHAALAWYCIVNDNRGNSVVIPIDAVTGRVVETALDMAGDFDVILPELHKRVDQHPRERQPTVDGHIVA